MVMVDGVLMTVRGVSVGGVMQAEVPCYHCEAVRCGDVGAKPVMKKVVGLTVSAIIIRVPAARKGVLRLVPSSLRPFLRCVRSCPDIFRRAARFACKLTTLLGHALLMIHRLEQMFLTP